MGGMTRSGQTLLLPMPALPGPVLVLHGMRDRLVLYDGGSSPDLNFRKRWKLSAPDAASFWAAVDRCKDMPETGDVRSGRLRATIYGGCANDTEVRLLTIVDGGHEWPGNIFPADTATRSTAAEILAFFSGFQRRDGSASGR